MKRTIQKFSQSQKFPQPEKKQEIQFDQRELIIKKINQNGQDVSLCLGNLYHSWHVGQGLEWCA